MKRILFSLCVISSLAACVPIVGHGPHHRGPVPVPRAVPIPLSFDVIDTNKDKRITRVEFSDSLLLAPDKSYMPTRDELFERIDRNRDGFVSRYEYNKHLSQPTAPAV